MKESCIEITNNVSYLPEAEAILMTSVEDKFNETNLTTQPIRYLVPIEEQDICRLAVW